MKPELKKLINKFNDNQKQEVEKLMNTENDKYLINYSILAIALGDDLVYGDASMIKEFYNVDDLSVLNHVDIIIAKVITTLSNKLNRDIKAEYESALVLNKSQPELTYLTKVVEEYLSWNKKHPHTKWGFNFVKWYNI